MKKLLIALGVSAAMVSGVASAADIEINRSTLGATTGLTVTGEVLSNSCHMNPPTDSGFLIELDQIEQNELNKVENAKAKFIEVNLTACPAAVLGLDKTIKKNVALAVLGGALNIDEDKNDGVLKNKAATLLNVADSEMAQNVYIRVLKEDNSPWKFGRDNAVTEALALNKEDITFKIGAEYYRKNGQIATPGKVAASSTINVFYK